MPKVTLEQARRFGHRFGLNFNVVPVRELCYGMNVELEHGTRFNISNITNNNLEMTFKIALAHLLEYPDYYARLKRMEDAAESYWDKRSKPSIFLDD